ncbi:alpha-glycosidase [Dorea longicatena]|uniref:Alpha-glycosidase n=1 Tax=Dorea longicatena TaxID=88431 RepID=A0A6N9JWF9_9FIRM|nr:glycoside hydrolase family 13 protein [Dorea longicatena]MZK07703.1 alpha-glycosidase [Dorea longicatena]MZK10876.1 alpha-glycosidase [Dorea longicatena]MZK47794.1 alpha-glycosidase [Dorea longicatena]
MNKAALFCDGTEGYVYPPEPKENELVTFRFRTAKDDVDRVGLVTSADTYVMEKECTQGEFDYYTFETRLGEEPFRYCFEVQSGTEKYYYGRCGISREILEYYNFVVVPGFSTPDWAKGAVMYQIFTDRFYNGDKSNDVETNEYYYIGDYSRRVTNWDKYPANMGVREFYGGDLQGVMDKLDYLQDLGVEVVYFNPLFVSPSNHKYDIQDYDYIDPHYGKIVDDGGEVLPNGVTDNSQATKYKKRTTGLKNLEASNELFIKLVEELHRRGMKVILDGVFNHCGSFNKWMDRERIYEGEEDYEPGAYVSADSPYRSYFRFFKEGPENWPYNGNYDGWWGHDTLPKLNYEDSVKLENYILYIGRKWVSPPYNVDGWRLDVAADLGRSNEYNHEFWQKFRRAVKDANPNALILAEHYGDPRDWLKGDEWDTVMNYDAFMEPVTWFLTGMEKHSDEAREELLGNIDNFIGSMAHHMSNMLTPSLQVAMNELSNHDHSRFLTRTNHMVGRVEHLGPEAANEYVNKAVMREAVVMQMTWVGAPTVYYGDEAGVCGFTDPDNRRTYPWGHEDQELIAFHKEAIRIHKEHPALKTGSLKILGGEENILSYARFKGHDRIIVVINNRSERAEVKVPVWEAEIPIKCRMKRLLYSYKDGYTTEYEEYLVEDGEVVANMGPHSALVLGMRNEEDHDWLYIL